MDFTLTDGQKKLVSAFRTFRGRHLHARARGQVVPRPGLCPIR